MSQISKSASCELVCESGTFFWRGQVLCSTFCYLRVGRRFEVELAARRLGTKLYVDSSLGGLYHLSHEDKKLS